MSTSQAMPLMQWHTVINVNLTGQFLCARAAIREFLRRGIVPVDGGMTSYPGFATGG